MVCSLSVDQVVYCRLIVIFRYAKNLVSAKNFGIRKGIISGAGMGFFFFVIFGSYALAFWYGGKLVREENYSAGRMLIVSLILIETKTTQCRKVV